MESRVEGIFLVLVDLCMNYWEIRLACDLWRAALGSALPGLWMGSVPRLALLWTGVRAAHIGAVIAVLARMVFFIRNLIFFWRQRPEPLVCSDNLVCYHHR